ncbi:hypothetical protein PCK1_002041 [Pneumocystis canis]|nr:hypothetical protein PCK1_002041 [Pneumocystis canis]
MVSKHFNKLYSKSNTFNNNNKKHNLSYSNIKKKRKNRHANEKLIEKLDHMILEIYTIDLIKNSNTLQNIKEQEKKEPDTQLTYLNALKCIEKNINNLQMNK